MKQQDEATRRSREEREDRDRGIVKDPDRYVRHRGRFYSNAEIRTIYTALRPGADDIVVDLGSGVGRICMDLARRVRSVTALDFSHASLAILRQRIAREQLRNVNIAVADLRHLPLEDASYTKAVSCQVIQHIPSDEWRVEALREVWRILRPGGRVVFTVYQWGSMVRDKKESDFSGRGYRRAFTHEELRDLLTRAGFTRVTTAGVIHLPHRLIRFLPGFLWPVETALSRTGLLGWRATYLMGVGTKP